ncbi:amidohydrolase [Sphingomonas sp. LM7]|nr:amidohydrolase [Sphingomonas sp. LM7]
MLSRRQLIGQGAAMVLAGPALAAERSLDLALVNARVWTGEGAFATLSAVGVIGDRIAAIGAGAVRARSGSGTRVVDLQGAFLMPAFIDNHSHFLKGSRTLTQPDLLSSKDRADFAARLGAAARAHPDRWILGGGWDEQRLGGELPTREWIDAATGDTPVAVPRTDLHMYLLNSAAIRAAGITRRTPDPAGGVIGRDAKGEPSGIFKDNANLLWQRVLPPPSEAANEEALRHGIAHGLRHGVAQVHIPEIEWETHASLQSLRARGEPGMRFYSLVPLADWEKMAAIVREQGRGDDWLRWGGVKALADGSLGSRTALFRRDYADAPGQHGVRVTSLADLRRWILGADKAGLHVTTHAIGDEANDDVLDILGEVARINGPRDRRFRIEHAQHCRPATIPRFARQKVIASVQPYHAIDDGRWAVQRIGPERLDGTYAFKSFLDAGATVTFGSDFPVAPLDPLTGVFAAISRETIDGANPRGWLPDQKVSMIQTLTAYTGANAYAGFQEDRLGAIRPGYIADLTVLDADLFTVAPDAIPKVQVLRTLVGGRERFGPDAV